MTASTTPRPALHLALLADRIAICRLAPDAPVPSWACGAGFLAIVRTDDELSIMCRERDVPAGVTATRDWRVLKLRGPLDVALVGILLAVAAPLAEAGVSIMPVATYDTDYVLVQSSQLDGAIAALRGAGHAVSESPG